MRSYAARESRRWPRHLRQENQNDVISEVKVSNRAGSTFFGLLVSVYPLLFAAIASKRVDGVLGALLVVFFLGLMGLAIGRGTRMAVVADSQGLTVRNFGRDYKVPWSCVESIDAARSNNITGAVTTIYVRRKNGKALVGRGASSYSRAKVERWAASLRTIQPASA
jgi:hypothetical protein